MTILDEIFEARKDQLNKEKEAYHAASFKAALKQPGLSIIGEMKRASPSKGQIAEANFDIEKQSDIYQEKGVSAYSVLTEETYFKGNNEDLIQLHAYDMTRPIIRKDFIFDPHQVFEAKVIGASAILLIVKMLEDQTLYELHKLANQLGLDVLVEVHDLEELRRALTIPDIQIIGINNRNLETFETNLDTTKALLQHIPNHERYIVVSESGYMNKEDIAWAETIGVDALLIGEGLMKGLV